MDGQEKDASVYSCIFQLHIVRATVSIRFPCSYFIEWKSNNGKKLLETEGRPIANNSII